MKMLRLASARRRLRAFVEQIEALESSDFPHEDGRAALRLIKRKAKELQERELDRLPDNARVGVDRACEQVLLTVRRYTEILGFILRSTNVRNAFEVHFPLKRLITSTIGNRARLIMSSEWKFVPFTYPMTIEFLPDYVLVGGPASESDNVFIVPLAGHEIGHSAWRHHNIRKEILPHALVAVLKALEELPPEKEHLTKIEASQGGVLQNAVQAALKSVLKQAEELFCDIFGLYVFGSAYLYAYEYFLAPGGQQRSVNYPSSLARVRYNVDAAQDLNIPVASDLFIDWGDSASPSGYTASLLTVADRAVSQIFPQLLERTKELLQTLGVRQPEQAKIDRARAAFERHVPESEGAYLSEIVVAGWEYLREKGGLGLNDETDEFRALNELMLKSVEVSEFLLRVRQNA